MIILVRLINIITIVTIVSAIGIYALRLVAHRIKEYQKKGHLQKKIVVLSLCLIAIGSFSYILDVFQYLNGSMRFYVYPHSLLPIDAYVHHWHKQRYFLYPHEEKGKQVTKTLLKTTYCDDFCFQSLEMLDSDSQTWSPTMPNVIYQSLKCTNKASQSICIPMATILSYGFNKTDFVMQIQDTIGQHHWIRVLPSQYQYYPTNGKKAKSELHLNYRYVLLSENDITKKYYHWIQLRNLSKVQKIFRNTCSLLWLVSFFILLPVIRLMWIITIVRLLVQKYNQYHKRPKQVY